MPWAKATRLPSPHRYAVPNSFRQEECCHTPRRKLAPEFELPSLNGTIIACLLVVIRTSPSFTSGSHRLSVSVGAIWLFLFNSVSPLLAQTWTATSLPSTEYMRVASSADGATLLAGPWNGPIYASTNSGATWMALTPPVPPGSFWEKVGVSSWHGLACSADGSVILGAAANGGLCVSTNLGVTWSETILPDLFQGAACSADGTRLVAVADHGIPSGQSTSGIYLSDDGGNTWTQANAPALMWFSVACSADRTTMVAGPALGQPVYVSTNAGATWNATGVPGGVYGSVACSADGTRMIAGSSSPGGVFTSKDSGVTWTSPGLTNWSFWGVACSADGQKLAAAAKGGTIFLSSDSGVSWTPTAAPLTNWYALAGSADGNALVAASMNVNSDNLGLVYTTQTTPVPELKLNQAGEDLALSWAVPSRKFVLQQSSAASNPDWVDVAQAVTLNYTSLQYQVTVPRTELSKYYRLISR